MISATNGSQWKHVPLGSIAKFRNGINYNKGNFGTGIKVVNVKDFQNRTIIPVEDLDEINPKGVVSNESLLKNGDIIFVRSNGNRQLIGRSLFVNELQEKVTHSAFTIRARFTSDLAIPRFYSYLFRSSFMRQIFSSQGSGTNINNLNQKILEDLQVPLPSLPSQRKIAAILTAYDDLIENNTRRIKILEEMAQMLYREWFVRFRFPGKEKLQMVDSPLGSIPKEWTDRTLSELCSKLTDGTHDTPEPSIDGFFLVTGKHIVNGFLDFTECYCISPEEHEKVMARSCPEKGDIIFSNIGTLGSTALVDQDFEYSIKNVALFKPLKKIYSNFIYLYLSSPETLGMITQKASGTSQKFFSLDFLRKTVILVPDDDTLTIFDNMIKPIIEQRSELYKKNINLRRTRDLLLPKLISGEFEVSKFESLDGRCEA